jgi:signal transduction histidine kinase
VGNALLFEEISKEKKEWERTFDAITDMVWIRDFRQKVVRANKALLSKTSLAVAEVSEKHCTELLHKVGKDTPGECLCSDAVVNNKSSFHEALGVNGSIFHFWAYPLIDDEGQLYAIVHYIKDVTDRKRLEQQLIRADRLASLGTLAAGIAHEINNPLGIIAGYSEALIDRAKNGALLGIGEFEDFPEYLETIHKEIFRCKEILASLLEFARPHKTKTRELDINELIKEVILLVNHKAKVQHHDIELKLNRDLPRVCADPGSLRQLFMNIIINSMYFTPEGGSIEIRTGLNKSEKRRGMIKITIRDTGSGIPRDVMDKIFDPFFTTKPIGEGSGLGLAISHKIAQEHGGFIDLKSDKGKGTNFIINLPAIGADDKTACS